MWNNGCSTNRSHSHGNIKKGRDQECIFDFSGKAIAKEEDRNRQGFSQEAGQEGGTWQESGLEGSQEVA
jgi:hypothetical protein